MQKKPNYPLLRYNEIRALIEHFTLSLNKKQFLSEEAIFETCEVAIRSVVFESKEQWKEQIRNQASVLKRSEDKLSDARLGLTKTVRSIRTVAQVQVELLKYYEHFVEAYNEYHLNAELLKRYKKESKAGGSRRAKSKTIWKKGKQGAAYYCLEILAKHPERTQKDVCKEFLKKWSIKDMPEYTVDALMNYVSLLKTQRKT